MCVVCSKTKGFLIQPSQRFGKSLSSTGVKACHSRSGQQEEVGVYAKRRQQWMEEAGAGAAGLWIAPPVQYRNSDSDHKYRQHSDLLYLTGCEEPGIAVLLRPGHEHPFTLFVRPLDPAMEIWTGRRLGPERAKETLGADAVFKIDELYTKLPELLVGCDRLHYRQGLQAEQDRQVQEVLNKARRFRRRGKATPGTVIDSGEILHEMRLCKDESELALMRKAATITADAHRRAMSCVRPGQNEYQLEALIRYHFRSNGCTSQAYGSIVGGGDNATILHYVENNMPLEDGDLVLIDAGGEYDYYAADITRTFPVNGRFSEPQKQVYEIVLQALEAGIEACRPGNTFDDVHQAAVRCLTAGLLELGVLEGDLETLLKEEAYKPYYMHKTSHWLGLDTHDVGRYFEEDEGSRVLKPGMVLTVEPGLYFNEMHIKPPGKPYLGIGVRIEDDILITEDGYENLTVSCPKTVADIEALFGSEELP